MQLEMSLSPLSVCMRSTVMSTLWKFVTITESLISAGTVNCFTTQLVACFCALRLDASGDSMLNILYRSLSLLKIGTWTECMGRIIQYMGKIPFMRQLMYVVPSEMSTAKFSTAQNHVRTCTICILPINRMVFCTLVDSSVAFRSLGAWRRLMQHL